MNQLLIFIFLSYFPGIIFVLISSLSKSIPCTCLWPAHACTYADPNMFLFYSGEKTKKSLICTLIYAPKKY